MKRYLLAIIAVIFANGCKAQSYTFNHDESFMQQFLFTETGEGRLTPDLYYDLFHKSYRNTYMGQGKLAFRTWMATTMFKETPLSEKLDTALQNRAKIESLNILDRQPYLDIAWIVEGPKIEKKLQLLLQSINNITAEGGKQETKDLFQEEYDKYCQAIESVKESYLASSERKLQFLEIYKDIVKTIELCDNAVLYIKCTKLCEIRKKVKKLPRAQLVNMAIQAHGRWKTNLISVSRGNVGSNGENGLPITNIK